MASLPSSFGFVGLGAMGFPMATQLRQKMPSSTPLAIYDLNESVLQRFTEEHRHFGEIYIAGSAREVAERADCIITIVPEGKHVKAVYLAPETGLLTANISGKLFIESSTIDIATSLQVGKAVLSSQTSNPPHFYDAPVSGGTAGAEKGTIAFMIGTSTDDPMFPLLKHICSFMGAAVDPCGQPGLGLAAKLSNNYLSATIALATAEAMNLGMRCGMDPKALSQCFATSSGASRINLIHNPVPGVSPEAVTSRDYQGGFKVQLMVKDILLAMDEARRVDAKLPLSDSLLGAYEATAADPRCRDRDNKVVYRWLGGYEPEVKKAE